jgi:hypothetical protein
MHLPITTLRLRCAEEWEREWNQNPTGEGSSWAAATQLLERKERVAGTVRNELLASSASSSLVIDGSGMGGEYRETWVELAQCGRETSLERWVVPDISKPTPADPHTIILRMTHLAGLCEASCRRLARLGFWELESEVGEPMLDGCGAVVWCKLGDRCHRVRFWLDELDRRLWGMRRIIRFWLTASVPRLRLVAWRNRFCRLWTRDQDPPD